MNAHRYPRQALATALLVAVAGCAIDSPPSPADLQRATLAHTTMPANWKAGGVAAPLADSWLATFNDPALQPLVAEAWVYNADIEIASARVRQANGALQVASASLLPWVDVQGIYSGKSGGGGALNALAISASLELDFWGRVRYGQAAAEAQSAAAQADYAFARLSLAATVTKAWYLAIEASLQRVIVGEALRSAQELQRVAKERLRVGVGDEQAVTDADLSVGNYRDSQRQIEQSREQALRALELLLGRYPSAEIAVAQRLAPMPGPVPVGMPSELLERRPDVIAAERRVAAAFSRVGEAKAARLPRISLTAGLNSISSDVIVLNDRTNPAFGFGANLFAPLYQGGALRAQVDVRNAEQQQAMAEYARIAQRSFSDVENALASENALRDRDAIIASNIALAARALELAQVQYRVGKTDLRAVEQRQLALNNLRMSQLRVQTERLAQRANLYLALGGPMDPAPPPAAPASAPTTTAMR